MDIGTWYVVLIDTAQLVMNSPDVGPPLTPIDISSLNALPVLTVGADIANLVFGNALIRGQLRFSWLVSLLSACSRPSSVETIRFLLPRDSADSWRDLIKLPWAQVDKCFSPSPESRWPNLTLFEVLVISESEDAIVASLEAQVSSLMPTLHRANCLKIRLSNIQ